VNRRANLELLEHFQQSGSNRMTVARRQLGRKRHLKQQRGPVGSATLATATAVAAAWAAAAVLVANGSAAQGLAQGAGSGRGNGRVWINEAC
jgi:hypothetical protein